jgi:CDP-diacylglycerol---serine O-phosphatidyltransferase
MITVNPVEEHSHVEDSSDFRMVEVQPKEKRRRLRRSLKLLPNLFTLANAFFGFCAIVFAAHKNPHAAAYCILLGASMDALDGRIARLIHSTSPLGMQLDSLADAITFCLAPAFIIYICNPDPMSVFVFLSCAFYLLAGVFRLARFNITSQQQTTYFIGLPTTLAGCFLAIALLSFPIMEYELYITLLMTALAMLKISRWRFPTFKQASKRWVFSAIMLIGATTATFGFNRVLFVLYVIYFALGAFETMRIRFSKNLSQS